MGSVRRHFDLEGHGVVLGIEEAPLCVAHLLKKGYVFLRNKCNDVEQSLRVEIL